MTSSWSMSEMMRISREHFNSGKTYLAFALAILWMTHLLNPYLILVSAFLFGAGFAFLVHDPLFGDRRDGFRGRVGFWRPFLREELLARVPFPLGDTSPRLYRAGLAGRLILAEIRRRCLRSRP
jgi:hypothetical protein